MKHIRQYICILSAALCCATMWAYDEVSHGAYPVKLPQSPNVAEFPQYGDVPVNHYTGTMTLNIPIYEIDVDGCKVPISLTNSATGIKVAQHASNVGLGWQLNCGGIITADCYGKNDFDCRDDGYVCNRYENGIPEEKDLYAYTFSNKVDITQTDTRPDIFHYSFCGNTGAMIFPKNEMESPTQIDPKTYLDITYTHSMQNWTIHDGNGNTYQFGEKYHVAMNAIVAESATYGSDVSVITKDDPNVMGYNWDYKSINAWPLDTITTRYGRKIIFRYKRESILTPMIPLEEIRVVHIIRYCANCTNCDIPWRSNFHSQSSSNIIQSVFCTIIYPGGKVTFHSSPRTDIWSGGYMIYNDAGDASKIDSIIVTNSLGKVVKRAVFHYHYAGNTVSPNTCRLMLDSITGLEQRPYRFFYNDEYLPKKNSKQIDMWGYYNASEAQSTWSPVWSEEKQAEGTLIPSLIVDSALYYGRNRQCNPQTVTNGTLQRVVYPTGGYSIFEYEPHTFATVETDAEMVDVETTTNQTCLNLGVEYYDHGGHISVSTSAPSQRIYYSAQDTMHIHIKTHSLWGGPSTPACVANLNIMNSSGKIVYTTQLMLYKDAKEYDVYPILDKNKWYIISISHSGVTSLELPQPPVGTQEGMIYVCGQTIHQKKKYGGNTIEQGGGIRIKTISSYDNDGEIVQRKAYQYTYDDSVPSGLLMVQPRYANTYLEEFLDALYPTVQPRCYPLWCSIVSSSMLVPAAPMLDPIMVGYKNVTEVSMPVEKYGRTELFFNCHTSENPSPYPNFYTISKPFNGQLRERHIYDGADVLRQKETFTYTRTSIASINGLHSFKFFPERYYKIANQQVANVALYKYQIKAWNMTGATCNKTDYVDGGAITKTTVTQYDSINHLPLVQQTYTTGDTITVRNVYAASSRTNHAELLQNHYMYNAPLQQTEERNGETNTIYDYLYAPYWHNVVLQQVRSTHNGTDSVSSYLVKSVDGYGNPTCIETPSGVPTAYLWGCGSLYPIVEVAGATYEQIEQAMGNEGFLSMLQTNCDIYLPMLRSIYQELIRYVPMGDIHIRTYSPSVGILNEITPQGVVYSYEYDDYNRLTAKYMETEIGRVVIEKHQYHFREP